MNDVQCCIAGGGPAGMMLGYLLARSGVWVVVLEKHADSLRDLRGDTIRRPSQKRIIGRVLHDATPIKLSWLVRLLNAVPWLQRIPARIVGVGFQPEHPMPTGR